jgi:hypothetical protein
MSLKRVSYILCLTLFSSPAARSAAQQAASGALPRVFLLDAKTLADQKHEANGKLLVVVREAADRAMQEGPFSVMDKDGVPPSGDKHDFMSQAPYWWPNPKNPNGLPYVRRDGETNPEIKKISDHDNCQRMQKASRDLALAFYLTGNEAYAQRAALLLRTWFLNAATRMNPNLNFGQGIPGITQGRGTGIIGTRGLVDVVDAVGLLAGSRAWTAADQKGMEEWFAGYLSWLQNSSNGKDESAAHNNHGTFYDLQVADFALFVGKPELARDVLKQSRVKRLARQVNPDGSQSLELARTRGFSYSVFNLRALMSLADLGERVGVDLWNFQTKDGRSIRHALDFLLPYATGSKKWEYRQITEFTPQELVFPLLKAAMKLRNPDYERAAEKIGIPDRDLNVLIQQQQIRSAQTAESLKKTAP